MSTIPILFTIDGSVRHELILVPPKASLYDITTTITQASASSPNCEEFMSKYKSDAGNVSQIKVRWNMTERDAKVWPASTVVTEENCEAVLKIIDPARDVLEVTMSGK